MKKSQINFTAYRDAFKKTFNFLGKANRKDYWTYLGTGFILIPIPLGILISINPAFETLLAWNAVIHAIPLIALSSRRLRDAGESPFWLLSILSPRFLGIFIHNFLGIDYRLAFILGIIPFLYLLLILFKSSKQEHYPKE